VGPSFPFFVHNCKDLAHSPTNTLWPRPGSADHRRKLAPNYLVELLVKKEWLSFLDNVGPGFLARPGRGEFELRSLFGDLLFGIGKIVP